MHEEVVEPLCKGIGSGTSEWGGKAAKRAMKTVRTVHILEGGPFVDGGVLEAMEALAGLVEDRVNRI
jgi:hypothetical protein